MSDTTNFKTPTMKKETVGLFETLLIIYKTNDAINLKTTPSLSEVRKPQIELKHFHHCF